MSEVQVVVFGILPSTISLIAWVVAVIFAVKIIRNGGGRPERLLLIGICLMLAGSVIGSAWAGLNPLLVRKLIAAGTENISIAMISSAINVVRGLISLAGIILLVYAFWQRFKTRPTPNKLR